MSLFSSIREVLNEIEKYHDTYTMPHEYRTGRLMSILGCALGLKKSFYVSLEEAGSLHDIGKIFISPTLLEKIGPLSSAERDVLKSHVKMGHEITKKIKHPLGELTSTIVITHHESYDGSGYPYGLKGEAIPIEGRICCICDVYDALRSERPYRESMSHEEVIQMMQDTKLIGLVGKFDPDLFKLFAPLSNQFMPIYETNWTP